MEYGEQVLSCLTADRRFQVFLAHHLANTAFKYPYLALCFFIQIQIKGSACSVRRKHYRDIKVNPNNTPLKATPPPSPGTKRTFLGYESL